MKNSEFVMNFLGEHKPHHSFISHHQNNLSFNENGNYHSPDFGEKV